MKLLQTHAEAIIREIPSRVTKKSRKLKLPLEASANPPAVVMTLPMMIPGFVRFT
jgi:hypothetical protein